MKKSIVWLRAIACLMITNHHLGALYPQGMEALGFGGYLGDCLYFVISGYCLAECASGGLKQFVVKRSARIYVPFFLFLPFLIAAEGMPENAAELIFPLQHYHFLPTILTIYPLFYICSILNQKDEDYLFCGLVVFILQMIYYFKIFDFSYPATAQYSILPMMSYFEMMLLGGALRTGDLRIKRNLAGVLAAAAFVMYGYIAFFPLEGYFMIGQLFIGLLFSVSTTAFFLGLESSLPAWKAVKWVGGMTLEVYLVQHLIIEAFEHTAFPTGLVMCWIAILSTGYCLYWISEIVRKQLLRWCLKMT